VLLFFLWIPWLLLEAVWHALVVVVESLERVCCANPDLYMDDAKAKAMGAIIDPDGRVVGREGKMPAATVVFHFVYVVVNGFVFLAFLWGVVVAMWYAFGGIETSIDKAYATNSVIT